MNILITGATGFIGQEITKKLSREGHHLYILVRPESLNKAQSLFRNEQNITYIQGDITHTDVLHKISDILDQLDKIDTVVHLAALYELNASYEDCYHHNVIGTQNVIALISKLKSLKYFHYFSTYAVNPLCEGSVSEDFLCDDSTKFPDAYSLTKNHAEHLVRNLKNENFKTIIHRPGIIIGDSRNGVFQTINGPYHFLNLVLNIKNKVKVNINPPFIALPIDSKAKFPLLPVDVLSNWASLIISHPPIKNRTYHLISPQRVNVREFIEQSLELLGIKTKVYSIPGNTILTKALKYTPLPSEILFYANQKTTFETTHLFNDYPKLEYPFFQNYLSTIIYEFKRLKNERNH